MHYICTYSIIITKHKKKRNTQINGPNMFKHIREMSISGKSINCTAWYLICHSLGKVSGWKYSREKICGYKFSS